MISWFITMNQGECNDFLGSWIKENLMISWFLTMDQGEFKSTKFLVRDHGLKRIY